MVRRATIQDAQRISEIIVYGWRFAYQGIISENFLYGELSVVKRYQSLLEVLKEEHGFYVYEENQVIRGMMVLSEPRNEEDAITCSELVAIYVEPAFKGNGVGTKLLEAAEQISRLNQKQAIRLWVLEKNMPSRQFYEKRGFISLNEILEMDKLKQNEIRYEKKL